MADSQVKVKNNRKRKETEEVSEATPKKSKNVAESSKKFTEIEFKFMLRDVNTRFSGMDKFVEQASEWTDQSDYDLVSAYCRSSGDCYELLKLLETEPGTKRKPSEVHSILSALGCILSRLASNPTSLRMLGPPLAQKILSCHLSVINRQLAMRNKSSHIKSALKLLAAMAKQGPASCRLLIMTFDFQADNFKPLLNRRDSKDPEDVRACMMNVFEMLLIHGSPNVLSQLVQEKGLLNGIFPGMFTDKAASTISFLSALTRKVVQSLAVSKTLKTRLFNARSLREIGRLYLWKGPARWQSDSTGPKSNSDEAVMDTDEEDINAVRSVTHKLLMELCTSPKHGIVFHDASYGSSNKNMNPLVLAMLQSLERPYSDDLMLELVLSSLRVCPDLVRLYLPSLHHSLTPRNSPHWFSCIHMVTQVFKSLDEVFPTVSMKTFTSCKMLAVATSTMIPPGDIIKQLILTLKHEERKVRQAGLGLLNAVLTNLNSTLQLCRPPQTTQEFASQLRILIKKSLPSSGVLMQCWAAAMKKPTPQTNQAPQPDDNSAEHLHLLLSVLALHHRCLPPGTSSDADLMSLLVGLQTSGDVFEAGEDRGEMLTVALLELLSLSASQYLLTTQEQQGKSVPRLLLGMCQGKLANRKTVHLVAKIIAGNGAFEGYKDELVDWLLLLNTPFFTSNEAEGGSYLEFLSDCIETVLKKPHELMERIQEAVRDAVAADAALSSNSHDATQNLNIQEILKCPEEDLSIEITQEKLEESPTVKYRLPFSCLIVAVADKLDAYRPANSSVLVTCVGRVVESLLRNQDDPLPLCYLLWQTRDSFLHFLPSSITSLLNVYMTATMPDMKTAAGDSNSTIWKEQRPLSDLLQLVFVNWKSSCYPDNLNEMLEQEIDQLNERECVLCTKQLLQYITVVNKTTSVKKLAKKKSATLFLNALRLVFSRAMSLTLIESSAFDGDEAQDTVAQAVIDTVFSHAALLDFFLNDNAPISALFNKGIASIVKDISKQLPSVLSSNQIQKYSAKLCGELKSSSADEHVLDIALDFLSTLGPADLLLLSEHVVCNFQSDLTTSNIEGVILSSKGQLVLAALESLTHSTADLTLLQFTPQCLETLYNAALEVPAEDLMSVLVDLLEAVPLYCLQVEEFVLQGLLQRNTPTASKLACQVVLNSLAARQWCIEWILHNTAIWSASLDNFTGVVYALLTNTEPGLLPSQFYNLIHEAFWEPLTVKASGTICKQAHQLLQRFILHVSDQAALEEDFRAMNSNLLCVESIVSPHIVEVYTSLVNMLMEQRPQSSSDWLSTSFKTLLNVFMTSEESSECVVLTELLCLLKTYRDKLGGAVGIASELESCWTSLTKRTLKYHFDEPAALELLSHLLLLLEAESRSADVVKSLFEMLVSHSKFLPTMLQQDNIKLKGVLLSLMIQCVEQEAGLCEGRHMGVLLAAYTATLSLTDQKLLVLMSMYEAAGCDLKPYRPFVWGQAAADQHSLQSTLGPSLWREPSVDVLIDLIDPTKLSHSGLHFPLARSLQPTLEVKDACEYKSQSDCYDPAFILPALAHITGPEYVLPCRKFIEQGCLGYVLVALSSYDSHMRAIAYYILYRIYEHLEGARFVEKEQYLCLLTYLRNAAPGRENPKLASILTYFLSSAMSILLNPDCHLYKVVNQWLLSRPGLDLLAVPQFFSLFNSSSLEFEEERRWMLAGLSSALRDTGDYHVYQKRYAFKLLLSFYTSPLANAHTKRQILEVLDKAVVVKKAALSLVKHHGLVTWLLSALANRNLEASLILPFVSILDGLWSCLLDGRDDAQSLTDATPDDYTAESNTKPSGEAKASGSPRRRPQCLPPAFTSQMLLVCVSLIRCGRTIPSMPKLVSFCKCLASVLNHANKTNNFLGSVAQQPVAIAITTRDMLSLLYQRATLACDCTEMADVSALFPSGILTTSETPDNDSYRSSDQYDDCYEELFSVIGALPSFNNNREDTVTHTLYLLQWSLQKMEKIKPFKVSRLCDMLKWFSSILTSNDSMKRVLLSEAGSAQQTRILLLKLSYHVRQNVTLTKLDPANSDANLASETLKYFDAILLGLLDFLTTGGLDEETETRKSSLLLKQKSYVRVLKKIGNGEKSLDKSNGVRRNLVQVAGLLLQEAWLGKAKPSHAAAALDQVYT